MNICPSALENLYFEHFEDHGRELSSKEQYDELEKAGMAPEESLILVILTARKANHLIPNELLSYHQRILSVTFDGFIDADYWVSYAAYFAGTEYSDAADDFNINVIIDNEVHLNVDPYENEASILDHATIDLSHPQLDADCKRNAIALLDNKMRQSSEISQRDFTLQRDEANTAFNRFSSANNNLLNPMSCAVDFLNLMQLIFTSPVEYVLLCNNNGKVQAEALAFINRCNGDQDILITDEGVYSRGELSKFLMCDVQIKLP